MKKRIVIEKKDLKRLKGKVLKPFEYSLRIEDFVKTNKFANTKRLAFCYSLGSISMGLLLPVMIGFFTSMGDLNEDYFRVVFISNSIVASIICLPLSLVLIWAAIPIYKYTIAYYLRKNGFVKIQDSIRNHAA